LLALVPLASSCGEGQRAGGGEMRDETPSSYRFSETTISRSGYREVMRGAYDWEARKGWADYHHSGGWSSRTIQFGDACFVNEKFDWEHGETRGRWTQSRVTPRILCNGAPFHRQSRMTEDVLRRHYQAVEKVEIRGTQATRYRLVEGTGVTGGELYDVWVDSDGLIVRSRQWAEDKSFVDTVDYFDFGVAVEVGPPKGKG
jgi:hypothetical protein